MVEIFLPLNGVPLRCTIALRNLGYHLLQLELDLDLSDGVRSRQAEMGLLSDSKTRLQESRQFQFHATISRRRPSARQSSAQRHERPLDARGMFPLR